MSDVERKEPSIEELRQTLDDARKALATAEERNYEKRSIKDFRETVDNQSKVHDDYVERQTSYDADTKARLFGFGAFTGKTGEAMWILAGSIFAVERDPNETFTVIKTASEPMGVNESPDEVFNELFRIRFEGSAENLREAKAELGRRVDEHEKPAEPEPETVDDSDPVDNLPDFRAVSEGLEAGLDADGFPFDGEDDDDSEQREDF